MPTPKNAAQKDAQRGAREDPGKDRDPASDRSEAQREAPEREGLRPNEELCGGFPEEPAKKRRP